MQHIRGFLILWDIHFQEQTVDDLCPVFGWELLCLEVMAGISGNDLKFLVKCDRFWLGHEMGGFPARICRDDERFEGAMKFVLMEWSII